MCSHSEEVWESFDAVWRRLRELGHQVAEMEARLGKLENIDAKPPGADFEMEAVLSESGSDKTTFVYGGEIQK